MCFNGHWCVHVFYLLVLVPPTHIVVVRVRGQVSCSSCSSSARLLPSSRRSGNESLSVSSLFYGGS
jgi:hypothetical protein